MLMPTEKGCVHCDREFTRKPTESNVEWKQRRYCSARCGLSAAGKAGSIGGMTATVEWQRAAAVTSCENHLRALIRYGQKHDGLPGLSADRFNEIAARLGMAA